MKTRKIKIISLVLSVCLIFSAISMSVCADEITFSDMPDNWATDALNKAVKNGLLNGYDGKIMPDDSLTRAQMAAIMVRAFGATDKVDISSFTDVLATEWYYEDMAKAVAMGIYKGDGTSLNPDNNITREEAFTVLARAFELEVADAAGLDAFSDKADISDWALPTVSAIVKNGYAKGSDGYLNPRSNITRAEFAVLMNNIVKIYINTPGKYDKLEEGTVMIRANGVTLSSVTVKGDLILGFAIGKKGVVLSNSTVTGRVVNDKNGDKIDKVTNNAGGGSAGGSGSGSGSGSGNSGTVIPPQPVVPGVDEGIDDGGIL